MSERHTTPPNARPGSLAGGVSLVSQIVWLLGGLVAVCVLAGALLAAFFLPLVTAASGVAKDGVNLFEALPSELEVAPLNEASRIEAADGSLLATFYSENRIMLPLEEIDPDLQHAVLAVEDRRFYEHNGVDPQGTLRALLSNSAGGSTQGGSTLTQQYVKNALLMDAFQRGDEEAMKAATESTYIRKLREAKLAISLEKKWTKDEILNGYLNVAQFGPSQYGVETAAQHYFSKSANDLTPGEAALLAGITNSPNNNDPVKHPENAVKRRNQVLHDMYSLDYISEEDYNMYREQPIEDMLKVTNVRAGCASAKGSGFFCDYATRTLLNDPAFGETREERQKLLYGGGLTIRTTLDPGKQAIAEEILNRKVPADAEHGFGHSIVTTEPGTGKILVMAQNRTFNPYQNAGVGETSLNYNAPKHLGGGNGFPVGSTFKPFVLTTYLSEGGTIWDTVATGRENFTSAPAHCLPGGQWYESAGWEPDNAVSITLPPVQTMLDATKFSVNTSYVRISQLSDLCNISEMARSMGVVPAYYDDSTEEAKSAPVQDIYGQTLAPSTMVLGEINISALDMASAYATFISGGKYCEPRAITQVLDRNGDELPITGENCTQVMDKQVADSMAWTLMQDLTDPRATGKGRTIPGHDAGGKTGTSGSQYHTWYVGFTGQLSTAVWFGNPTSNTRAGGLTIDGQYLRKGKVWGNTVSLPTWQEYMTRVSEGMPNVPFPAEPAKTNATYRNAAGEVVDESSVNGPAGTGPGADGSTNPDESAGNNGEAENNGNGNGNHGDGND